MQSLTAERDARLIGWIADELGIAGAVPGPLLGGGNANVTRIVEAGGQRMVLRHPPENIVSDKAAAGIRREYAACRALQGRARVPQAIGWCDDPAILGQPFSLTGWVDGVAVMDQLPAGWPAGANGVNVIGRELVTALAEVHAVDPDGLLPERFGRPDGFARRQIERWLAVRADQAVRELPLLTEMGEWLLAAMPPMAARASIIHCDYHLDNCLSRHDRPEIAAIIDWEMATLGDPRIDLGLALFFWRRDSQRDIGFPAIQAFSNRADALPREELAALWSDRTGFAASHLHWFMAFAGWRLAAIVEGAYVLFREGKVDTPYARGLERDVPALLAEAAAIAGRG